METEPISGRGGGVSRRRVLLGTAGTALTGLAGCLTRGEDSGLEGRIVIDGSNTLLPNSALVAEQFLWQNNQVQIPVSGSGTGAGFQQFCLGETDLQNASREISDDERELCRDNGIDPDEDILELEVVMDGIAVMKHPDNDWCDCLTSDQLEELWRNDSPIQTWADIDDDWPDEEISFYGRDAASGTFDYFTEEATGGVANIRDDYSGSPDTNVIVRGVRGNEDAIGFGGAGYYYENEDDLELIGIDDGNGCTRPTPETIEAEDEEDRYTPLARPMYLYVRTEELSREVYREFLRYYLENTRETAREVGFYAVPEETVSNQREKLENAIEEHT
ncbi:PstS family phosphate ABC transporter substrate-binding protein [Halostagnicola bangensis]